MKRYVGKCTSFYIINLKLPLDLSTKRKIYADIAICRSFDLLKYGLKRKLIIQAYTGRWKMAAAGRHRQGSQDPRCYTWSQTTGEYFSIRLSQGFAIWDMLQTSSVCNSFNFYMTLAIIIT